MINVSLIDFTGNGRYDPADWAASILIYTKNTRLTMTPALLDQIVNWPAAKKREELEYIANSIASCWEMVHYYFSINGVTRALTHQLVRTRTASFAQQTHRITNVSEGLGWDYATGPSIIVDPDLRLIYEGGMHEVATRYKRLIEHGAATEDARGILPTNILTNINMDINLRNFVDMVRKRSSPRVQGEYRDVLAAMKKEVLRVHPWTSLFFERTFDKAAQDLDAEIQALSITKEHKMKIHKLVDQMRQT